MLTQAILKKYLHYNSETGIFTHLISTNQVKVGCVAGNIRESGYVYIKVKGKGYMAHCLAWFYVHGVWPEFEIDHEDTIKHHNWLSNLRPATHSQNMHNTRLRKDNLAGYRGVSKHHKNERWVAQISYKGKQRYLGCFNTPEEAYARYLLFAEKIHGEFLHESLKQS